MRKGIKLTVQVSVDNDTITAYAISEYSRTELEKEMERRLAESAIEIAREIYVDDPR
jgi:hypothetical protein